MSVRTGAARGHTGYFHETAFYGSDDEFLAIVEPFLRDGVGAGEPTLVTCARPNATLLREAMPDVASAVTFVPGEAHYVTPAATIRTYQDSFRQLVRDGATQIRVVGDVPHPGVGIPWDSWARYEAVVNHAYDEFPLWGMCPYDLRTTPGDVLEEVERLHPHVATADGHHPNPHFCGAEGVVAPRHAAIDPVELTEPDVAIDDPSPAEARRLVAQLARTTSLDESSIADLVVAVSEIVSNAQRHGRPPPRLTGWTRPDRVVVTVRDAGQGPQNPFAGLLGPADGAPGGRGLWIAHQMCTDVGLRTDPEGFTVRLVMGSIA